MPRKQKKFKLPFLDWNRDGKGVDPNEDTTPNLRFFFKLFWRKLSGILSLNLMMLFQIAPILVSVYVYWSRATVPAVNSVVYPLAMGASIASGSGSAASLLLTALGAQNAITAYHSAIYIVIPIMAVILLATFGWQNTGATYVLRGMVRQEPVSLVADYFYAIRRNMRQGLFLGIIDCLILGFLGYDILFFWGTSGSIFTDIGFWLIIVIAILYISMRFYMYLLLVTFDLKNRKIIKNSLIFAFLGFKRNFMAILGVAVLVGLNVLLFFGLMQFNIAIGLILPLFYIMAIPAFMTCYAAYPVIRKYMIDPYYDENGNPLNKDGQPEENATPEFQEEDSEDLSDPPDAPAAGEA